MKTLKIDWDALENAFSNRDRDLVYYLDLVTGHVLLEGEGDELDDEDQLSHEVGAAPHRDDRTRAYIEAPAVPVRLGWMESFVKGTEELDPEFVSEMQSAMQDEEPASTITDVLHKYSDDRERWYMYRAERLHELIEDWLKGLSVTTTTPAPW